MAGHPNVHPVFIDTVNLIDKSCAGQGQFPKQPFCCLHWLAAKHGDLLSAFWLTKSQTKGNFSHFISDNRLQYTVFRPIRRDLIFFAPFCPANFIGQV
jgi:hypothetical protein